MKKRQQSPYDFQNEPTEAELALSRKAREARENRLEAERTK